MNDLYHTRTVLMAEVGPQSNHYHQVLLDPEQYKRVCVLLSEMFPVTEHHPQCNRIDCAEYLISDKGVDIHDMEEIHRCKDEATCAC